MVRPERAAIGTGLEMDTLGTGYRVIVIPERPYDPRNARLRLRRPQSALPGGATPRDPSFGALRSRPRPPPAPGLARRGGLRRSSQRIDVPDARKAGEVVIGGADRGAGLGVSNRPSRRAHARRAVQTACGRSELALAREVVPL